MDRLEGRWVAIELWNTFIGCPVVDSTDALRIVLRYKHVSNNSLQHLRIIHAVIVYYINEVTYTMYMRLTVRNERYIVNFMNTFIERKSTCI